MSWGAVAGAAISVVGGYMAQKQAGKKGKTDKQMEQVLIQAARENSDFGRWLMGVAKGQISASADFLNRAASGDREELMRLAQKDFQGISEGAQNALQMMSQVTPRTGASAEFLSNLPFNVAAQQQQLLSGMKADARSQLATMGTNLAQIGSGAMSQGNAAAGSVLDYNRGRRQDAYQQGAQTSAGLYQMFGNIMDAYSNRRAQGSLPVSQPSGTTIGGYHPTAPYGGSSSYGLNVSPADNRIGNYYAQPYGGRK